MFFASSASRTSARAFSSPALAWTPVPRVDSLDELNDAFARFEQAEENRRIGMRIRTIGQDFAHEAPLLLPLPGEGFETGLAFTPRVDRYGMVAVRACRYSVPARFIGRTVHALLRSDEVMVFHGRTEIARPWSTTSPPANGSRRASRSASSATPAPARPTC
jgi:hypothetical protein